MRCDYHADSLTDCCVPGRLCEKCNMYLCRCCWWKGCRGRGRRRPCGPTQPGAASEVPGLETEPIGARASSGSTCRECNLCERSLAFALDTPSLRCSTDRLSLSVWVCVCAIIVCPMLWYVPHCAPSQRRFVDRDHVFFADVFSVSRAVHYVTRFRSTLHRHESLSPCFVWRRVPRSLTCLAGTSICCGVGSCFLFVCIPGSCFIVMSVVQKGASFSKSEAMREYYNDNNGNSGKFSCYKVS